jgi:hypothetical protein
MAVTLPSNRMNDTAGRAHKPGDDELFNQEPTVIKCLAVIACVVGAPLLAGAEASACTSPDAATTISHPAPKDQAPKDQPSTLQGGK